MRFDTARFIPALYCETTGTGTADFPRTAMLASRFTDLSGAIDGSTADQWSRMQILAARAAATGPPADASLSPPTPFICFGEANFSYKHAAVGGGAPVADGASYMLQSVGGSELNVAIALSRIGVRAAWVSVLPTGPLGEAVLNAARKAGVDCGAVHREPGDLATLHVVEGEDGPRPLYQRSHSAFGMCTDGTRFDWDRLLEGKRWIHLTGITPLLGAGPLAAWRAAFAAAARGAPWRRLNPLAAARAANYGPPPSDARTKCF